MCGMTNDDKPPVTDAERLARITVLRKQLDDTRRALFAAIVDAFPENRGEDPIRGRLAEVSKRANWTREHVANIRDGRVTADGDD
jgi:hypothetical protein